MKNKLFKNIRRQVSAKKRTVGSITIAMLIIAVSVSTFLVFVPERVKAEEGGAEGFVGLIDAGDWATIPGLGQTSAFFYYNDSGAYIITLGGQGYDGVTSVVTNDVTRTTIDNTGGSVANTSVVLGTLSMDLYSAGVVFDWGNRTFYILGGYTPRQINVLAFSLDNNTCWPKDEDLPYAARSFSPEGIWYNETCYVFGGNSAADEFLGDVVCYCPGNDTAWKHHDLSSYAGVNGVHNPSVAYSGTGDICYIFGGRVESGAATTNKIVAYCFTNGSDWEVASLSRTDGGELLGVVYNNVNSTYIIGPNSKDTASNDITWWNTSIGGNDVVINNHTHAFNAKVVWDNRSSNQTAYFFAGGRHAGSVFNDIWKLDDFGIIEEPEGPSSYSIKGLPNDIITWDGVAGTTVWCNETGDTNEWPEVNMSINASTNVTELRVWIGNINNSGSTAWINATNITMYASSNNNSANYGEVGSFPDGGGNCTTYINNTNWNAGTMGANPFTGAGLTDKTASIYLIFKLTIPADAPTDTFWSASIDAWKVHVGVL